jgi:Probable zinc-ribbon domain
LPDKRYPRNRRGERGRRRSVKSLQPEQTQRRFVHDRQYGDIPLVRVCTPGLGGKVHQWWHYDPDYSPPLPPGAVRGNIRNQSFCPSCHVPKYFYVDEERKCVQCGESFTFRATEQKYWYENLKFNFSSVPVRCLGCRRLRRSEHALREQIARARAHVREAGSDPAAHLALARALVEYHRRTNQGDLTAAIASARRARRLWPESPEPLYWEGLAQAGAKRCARAREALLAFLAHPRLRDGALKDSAKNVVLEL